jgi:hypothetical protein
VYIVDKARNLRGNKEEVNPQKAIPIPSDLSNEMIDDFKLFYMNTEGSKKKNHNATATLISSKLCSRINLI